MPDNNITAPSPATLNALQEAFDAMPNELRPVELSFFIDKILGAYSLTAQSRLTIAMDIINRTEGAMVDMHVFQSDELSVADIEGMKGLKQ